VRLGSIRSKLKQKPLNKLLKHLRKWLLKKHLLLLWLPVAWIHSLLFNLKNLFLATRILLPSNLSTSLRHEVGSCGTQTLTLADGVPLKINLLKVQFSGTTSKLLVWLPILQWKKDLILLSLVYKSFCVPPLWLRKLQG
jgi:hypothetical protein